jgi:hypothetical protein
VILTIVALRINFELNRKDASFAFQFEKFEGVLYLGRPDVEGATNAFLKNYPLGASAGGIVKYFEDIGGVCLDDKSNAGHLICAYGHPMFPPLPLPVGVTWIVKASYDSAEHNVTAINISAGVEGL